MGTRTSGHPFHFVPRYALIAVSLFVTEACIAAFVTQSFIRYHLGDLLIVVFLYFSLRSVLKIGSLWAMVSVSLFAFVVEIGQAFHLIDRLGFSGDLWAKLLLGDTFQWLDIVMYAIGGAMAYMVDRSYLEKA